MHTPSFHRRILPWIFVLAFFAMAPALIFYTSGYRWNPKKAMIERYGTVIIDTTPIKADIDIDGRPLTEKTPYTIQNMQPGLHKFSISKEGYVPWQKNLDVYPEQVTFVNGIWLWKRSSPVNRYTFPLETVSASPDERSLLMISSTTPTHVIIFNTITGRSMDAPIDLPLQNPGQILWSGTARYALFEAANRSWIIDTQQPQRSSELPRATYRWSGNDLIGSTGRSQIRLQLKDLSVIEESFTTSTVDLSDVAELRESSGTLGRVYVSKNTPQTGFILPSGKWIFWSENAAYTMLRDGDRWLSLQERSTPPEYHIARGGLLRPFTVKKSTQYLLINDNEVWLWDPLQEPELLLRQSERIIGTEWHHEGGSIFVATEKNIFAIELDGRDGRLTSPLGTFDHITALTLSGKQIYVTATSGTQSGLWELNIE